MRYSPYTFQNLYQLSKVMVRTVGKTDCGILWGETITTDLDFANDIVILAETLEVLAHALDTLSTEYKLLGQKFSWIKSKIQKFVTLILNNIDLPSPVAVQGDHFSLLSALCTLGVLFAPRDDQSTSGNCPLSDEFP